MGHHRQSISGQVLLRLPVAGRGNQVKMRKNILAVLGVTFSFVLSPPVVSAVDNGADKGAEFRDLIIASAVKSALKAYIAAEDIEKLKKRAANLSDVEFSRKYAKAYSRIIKDSPVLAYQCRFSANMTKEQVLSKTRSWNKDKLYSIIDSLPNPVVSGFFRSYVGSKVEVAGQTHIVSFANNLVKKLSQGLPGK